VTPLRFLSAALVWNYGLGMTHVVVPLYAHAQGLSGAQIGVLFSLPVIAQVSLSLVGGAWSDRVGGKRILLGSSALMALGGLAFLGAQGFWALLGCQLVMIVSRATFWPATWSLASQLPGDRGAQMGRLNAMTNTGQIAGTASCGFLLAFGGFAPTFVALSLLGFASIALAQGAPAPPPKEAGPSAGVFAHFRSLLGRRIIWYSVLCAYLSAVPITLSATFFPLVLKSLGFGEDASGLLISLRAVGSIAAGLWVGRFVHSGPASLWNVGAGLAVALAVAMLPIYGHAAVIAVLMLVIGVGAGLVTLYFQITISEASSAAERGSAMALGGMGWGLSHFTSPLVVGLLADRYGLAAGFHALGAVCLACALALLALRPWAFRRA
jgi:MFS family permease